MANVLDSLNEIDEKVQAGEISGFVMWPESGRCKVEEVAITVKANNQYFMFKLLGEKGRKEFLVRIPNKNDKEAAKFMGMQKIYATVYSFGSTVGETTPQEAFDNARKVCAKRGYFKYTLSEYQSFSERTGKTFTNQSLESLLPWDDQENEEFI